MLQEQTQLNEVGVSNTFANLATFNSPRTTSMTPEPKAPKKEKKAKKAKIKSKTKIYPKEKSVVEVTSGVSMGFAKAVRDRCSRTLTVIRTKEILDSLYYNYTDKNFNPNTVANEIGGRIKYYSVSPVLTVLRKMDYVDRPNGKTYCFKKPLPVVDTTRVTATQTSPIVVSTPVSLTDSLKQYINEKVDERVDKRVDSVIETKQSKSLWDKLSRGVQAFKEAMRG